MTHTYHTHMHLCIFITISLFSASCYGADKQYEDCVPRNCGDKSITFPFFITGLQQPYCGAPGPGFNINCENNTRSLIRVTQEDQYLLVNEIFYDNSSLLVSDAEISNSASCSSIRKNNRNLTLSSDRFEYMNGSKLVFLRNCSEKEGLDKYRVDCEGDDYLVMNKNDANLRVAVCETMAEVPIQKYDEIITRTNYLTVLRRGFVLKWTATDCRECNSTGGRCGFDIENYRFLCFCEDRPHYKNCTAVPFPTSIDESSGVTGRRSANIAIAISASLVGAVLLGFCCICYRRRKLREARERRKKYQVQLLDLTGEMLADEQDIPLFPLDVIRTATRQFSKENKLGEGGFGPVYKGTLVDGKQIAVKRLSRNSNQGLQEFKAEINLIARLQHKNLVRLLGCCVEVKEMLLVYEFMPNGSLEAILFDSTTKAQLDWKMRHRIIKGIARGLLYLHEDSRLKIIHRDLKSSNVLLDDEYNPKISDFGMARIFGSDQSETNTNRVVGTFGYMAPEYITHGTISDKLDAFSFGVLLLEIISGKKTSRFHLSGHGQNLLTFAWKLWSSNQEVELIDSLLEQTYAENDVLRCIHIALLCVQEDPAYRPRMSSVVYMLENNTTMLPQPTEPAFFLGPKSSHPQIFHNAVTPSSVNEITFSGLSPR